MKIKFQNSKIRAVSSVVGNVCINIDDEKQYYSSEKQLNRLKKTIGFGTRYITSKNVTTYDLCKEAVKTLLSKTNLSPSDFDAIISVTQTPDYRLPGNAHLLHGDLKFTNSCIALDFELGCSGFIYGLFQSYLLSDKGFKRILLLNGDTLSKIINIKNRIDAPVFGDCGCATIIERDEDQNSSYFILKSDGSGAQLMIQKAGGFRNISTEETRKIKTDDNGNKFSDEDFYMSGGDVFTFTLTEQPPLLKEILKFSENSVEDIDYFIFHQANKFIMENIALKANIPMEKVSIANFTKYGNQSGASICATMCSELFDKLKNKKLILQGYGIGLSWGACFITTDEELLVVPTQIYKGE